MACEDHLRLANIIKRVHKDLRLETLKVGEDNAWKNHCSRQDVLKTYAKAMRQLATDFWAKNAEDLSNERAKCRVQWIVDQCNNYYLHSGCYDAQKKEKVLCEKYGLLDNDFLGMSAQSEQGSDELRVLDVGSCYNPFSEVPRFNVLPIDIAPASTDVLQCDFLNVKVSQKLLVTSENHITELPILFFDVVVFSLLLEYFPSPKQRFNCCQKAYSLLKPSGILCVVTPDSKHATANSKIMKMWRYALASIGFLRMNYEKLPHLHCMVFRKCINPKLTEHWLSLNLDHKSMERHQEYQCPEELMVIPQDFHLSKEDANTNYIRDDDDIVASNFLSLPQI